MDFRELSYIVAIARHQSVTKAANELYVTQPTLSKFVQNLEKHLGQPIFRRLGNKFLLTYAGERYVQRASEMLAVKRQLDQELQDIVRKDMGELNIAFPFMRGTYMLPATLPPFRALYPRVRMNVYEANSDALESMILQGSVDLAFFNIPVRSPDVSFKMISREEFVLVMAPNHRLAKRGKKRAGCKFPRMDLKLLDGERFILQLPEQRSRQTADRLFREARIEMSDVLQVRNIFASVQLAARGYGLAFVSESHLRHIDSDPKPAIFSVGNPSTQTDFVAAYRRGVYLPQYARDFIDIVRDRN